MVRPTPRFSRAFGVVAVSFYFAVGQQQLLRGSRLAHVLGSLRPVFAIGIPSLVASLSTPFGSAYLTSTLAKFGDEVIAGVSVFGRLMPLAFIGMLTMSMTLAPIIGQNFGAQRRDRVERALGLAGGISLGYVLIAGTALAVSAPWLVAAFQLTGEAAEVLTFYCRFISFTYVFFGLHLSATQTLTAMGKPMLSTAANLMRDLGLAVPLITWAATLGSPYAVIWAQYAATIIVGVGVYALTLMYVHRAAVREQVAPHAYHRPVMPYAPSRGH